MIEAANGYLDGSYMAESLEALQAAIEAAQTVAANDDATVAEVTEAITNLSDAIASLEKIILDTSALEHEIELVTAMLADIDSYVPSTVEGLADKLDAAKNTLENATSQAELDAAVMSLREARLNARTQADKHALNELIETANAMNLAGYGKEQVLAFSQALIEAQRVAANEEATQAEVNGAEHALLQAIDDLQTSADPQPDDGRDDLTPAVPGNAHDSGNGQADASASASTSTSMSSAMMMTLILAAAGLIWTHCASADDIHDIFDQRP